MLFVVGLKYGVKNVSRGTQKVIARVRFMALIDALTSIENDSDVVCFLKKESLAGLNETVSAEGFTPVVATIL